MEAMDIRFIQRQNTLWTRYMDNKNGIIHVKTDDSNTFSPMLKHFFHEEISS